MKGYVQYRQKQNRVNLSVMNVYAPTDESDDVGKDRFYQTVETAGNSKSNCDIKMVIRDLNARRRQEDTYNRVNAKHRLHLEINNNGHRKNQNIQDSNPTSINLYLTAFKLFFVLPVRSFLRDSPLNRWVCLTTRLTIHLFGVNTPHTWSSIIPHPPACEDGTDREF